jgi:hypothetical protein
VNGGAQKGPYGANCKVRVAASAAAVAASAVATAASPVQPSVAAVAASAVAAAALRCYCGFSVACCGSPLLLGHSAAASPVLLRDCCGTAAARQRVHAKKKNALHYNKKMESETDTGFVGGGITNMFLRGQQVEENKYRTFEIYGHLVDYQRFLINTTDKFSAIEVKPDGEKQEKPSFTSYIQIEFDDNKKVEYIRKRLFRTDRETFTFKYPELSRDPKKPSLIKMNPESRVDLINLTDHVAATIEVMDETTITFDYESAKEVELNPNELNIKFVMQPKEQKEYFKYLQIELKDSEKQGEIELNQEQVSDSENKPTIVEMNPKSQILLSAGEGRASVTLKIKYAQTSKPNNVKNNTDSQSRQPVINVNYMNSAAGPSNSESIPTDVKQTRSFGTNRPERSPQRVSHISRSVVNEQYSGANAAQICFELQIKFNGFARKACDELKVILEDAGHDLNSDQGQALLIEGQRIISEIQATINAIDQAQAS